MNSPRTAWHLGVMALVQRTQSPGNRLEIGDAILAAARQLQLGPARARLNAFSEAHRTFARHEGAVRRALQKLRAQQDASGEADAVQDAEVDALAAALAGDGYARANPFRILGFIGPSRLKERGHGAKAKIVIKLAAAVKKRRGVSLATLDAAARAARAARAVQAALAPISGLESARTSAIRARALVERAWDRTFAALKLAAKLAAADGDRRVLDALFTARRRGRKRRPPPRR